MNIKKYKLVWSTKYEAFENEVNALIEKGWQPLGGVSISYEGSDGGTGDTEFAQAMVYSD